MFDLLWVPNFIKIGKKFSFGTKFRKFVILGQRSVIPINILIFSMFDLFWVSNFIKNGLIAILRPNLSKFLISGQDTQFQISYLWLKNLTCFDCQISIALGVHFIFGTKFFWNEAIDNCFNDERVLLGRDFDFLGGYLVDTASYLGCCSLLGGYWWLLLVTARYCSFPLLGWTELNICFYLCHM